jgi:hypothetical protein
MRHCIGHTRWARNIELQHFTTEIYQSNAHHSRAPASSVYAALQEALDKSYQSVSRRAQRNLPMPFWIWCAIRHRHFGRARVMMYSGFIGCDACCRSPLSARCSGARHFLILRE